jgi:hypothetical protein
MNWNQLQMIGSLSTLALRNTILNIFNGSLYLAVVKNPKKINLLKISISTPNPLKF